MLLLNLLLLLVMISIDPHAIGVPEFPVVRDVSWPPRPRSSGIEVITKSLPLTLLTPSAERLMIESVMSTFAMPWALASMFPKSPTWRSLSSLPP